MRSEKQHGTETGEGGGHQRGECDKLGHPVFCFDFVIDTFVVGFIPLFGNDVQCKLKATIITESNNFKTFSYLP